MKLCILGPEKRSNVELKLIDKSKKIFRSVLYAPYKDIAIKNGKLDSKFDLSHFDVVLPWIDREDSDLGYLILNDLKDVYSPISPDAYLIDKKRFILLEFLRRNGVNVIDLYILNSRSSVSKLGDVKYPMAIASKDGVMISTNFTELKSMIDAIGFSRPVIVEPFKYKKYFRSVVVGPNVFSFKVNPKKKTDIFYNKGDIEQTKTKEWIKDTSLKISHILKSDFLSVTFIDKKVFDVNLKPDNLMDSELTDALVKFLKKNSERKEPGFIEGLRDVINNILGK